MSTKYKIRNQEALHFISFATVEWIDVFTRPVYKDIIVDSLKYCQLHKGMIVYAWCLMTNHLHLIMSSDGRNRQEDIIRDFKKFTSKRCLELIESNEQESRRSWMLWIFKSAGQKNINNTFYQFWRQDYHPIELDTNQWIRNWNTFITIRSWKEWIILMTIYTVVPETMPVDPVSLRWSSSNRSLSMNRSET
jgi:putative transposase